MELCGAEALSGLAPGPPDCMRQVALERPLLEQVALTVAKVDGLQAQLSRSGFYVSCAQEKAVRLQMLGSIFHCCDALQGEQVAQMAASWHVPLEAAGAAGHFAVLEPLLSLRCALLSAAKAPRPQTELARLARLAGQAHRGLQLLEVQPDMPREELLKLRWEQARCLHEPRTYENGLEMT